MRNCAQQPNPERSRITTYAFSLGYCPRYPDVAKRPGFDHGYSSEGRIPFAEGEKLCRDKGAALPVMESYSYGQDIAEFMGTSVNNVERASFWLGKYIL